MRYLEIFILIEKMKTHHLGIILNLESLLFVAAYLVESFRMQPPNLTMPRMSSMPYVRSNFWNFFSSLYMCKLKKSFRLSNKQLTFSDLFTRSMLAKNWIKTRLGDWILEDCPSFIKSLKRFSIYLDSPLHSGGQNTKNSAIPQRRNL